MKNLIFFLALACLCACGEDSLSDSIVGTWTLETIAIGSCPDASNNLDAVTADNNGCTVLNGTMVCQSLVIREDGTLTNTSMTNGVEETQEQSYTVNENANQVTACDAMGNCNTALVLDDRITISNSFGDCIIMSTYIK